MQSIDSKIRKRVNRLGGEAVFVPGDFLDLGSRPAVDLALHRMVKDGTLRRLTRGLYDCPKTHPALGVLLRKNSLSGATKARPTLAQR